MTNTQRLEKYLQRFYKKFEIKYLFPKGYYLTLRGKTHLIGKSYDESRKYLKKNFIDSKKKS